VRRQGHELQARGPDRSRTRKLEGRRVKQVDLVVESFQLLGRRLTVAGGSDQGPEEGPCKRSFLLGARRARGRSVVARATDASVGLAKRTAWRRDVLP
jgi:hypothetical protein